MEKSTDQIMDALQRGGFEGIRGNDMIVDGKGEYIRFIDQLISQDGRSRALILQKAGLPLKYGYKLLTGETRTRKRDYLIRIALALKLDLEKTQRLIKLAGLPALYPRMLRDGLIIVCINEGIHNPEDVSAKLVENHLPPLESVD